jgi:hypothetical protein
MLASGMHEFRSDLGQGDVVVGRTSCRPQWLASVAAAIAIALIAVAAFVISNLASSHPRPVQPVGEAVPSYYAAVTVRGTIGKVTKVDVTIRRTATGKVLATVPSPDPGFVPSRVAAAADDRTFVMAVVKSAGLNKPDPPNARMRFYLLRFDPGTDEVAISKLPINDVTESDTFSMALSADGRSLAVTTETSTDFASTLCLAASNDPGRLRPPTACSGRSGPEAPGP